MADEAQTGGVAPVKTADEQASRRKIPGNMPYTSSAGVLQRVLEKIPSAEKPAAFTIDFLGTVLGFTGGSARPVIPILKATSLLSQSGAPTELYGQFQTDGGRAAAALQALRSGYAEIFKRNQYAHRLDANQLTDVIVAITGLPKNDSIVRYILNTFQAFQSFARAVPEDIQQPATHTAEAARAKDEADSAAGTLQTRGIGLIYNINVVLPETTNIEVYNAIFRSLRANML